MMFGQRTLSFRMCSVGVTTFWAFAVPAMSVAGEPAAPKYTADGQLVAPVGYENWVFVGSNLGLAYRSDLRARTEAAPRPSGTAAERSEPQAAAPQFHNVYINPEAYAHFARTGEFPDPTILVMDRYSAADKEPRGIVSNGVFNGDHRGIEVAVKNLSRPDGSTTAWAYYDFTNRDDPSKTRATAPAFADSMCENCHQAHASKDNVWVQFYPVLRRLAK